MRKNSIILESQNMENCRFWTFRYRFSIRTKNLCHPKSLGPVLHFFFFNFVFHRFFVSYKFQFHRNVTCIDKTIEKNCQKWKKGTKTFLHSFPISVIKGAKIYKNQVESVLWEEVGGIWWFQKLIFINYYYSSIINERLLARDYSNVNNISSTY